MAEKTPWTPAPWREATETRGSEICTIHSVSRRPVPYDDGQRWVYIIADASLHRTENEQDANALLIAAAPELYEALERLLDTSRNIMGWDDEKRQASDALAKARGER